MLRLSHLVWSQSGSVRRIPMAGPPTVPGWSSTVIVPFARRYRAGNQPERSTTVLLVRQAGQRGPNRHLGGRTKEKQEEGRSVADSHQRRNPELAILPSDADASWQRKRSLLHGVSPRRFRGTRHLVCRSLALRARATRRTDDPNSQGKRLRVTRVMRRLRGRSGTFRRHPRVNRDARPGRRGSL